MKRLLALVSALLLGAACGGSDSTPTHNAASGKTFTYGTAGAADPGFVSMLDGQLAGATSLNSSPGVSSAQSLSDFSSVTGSLFGDPTSGIGFLAAPSSQRALRMAPALATRLESGLDPGSFDGGACVHESTNSITLDDCHASFSDSSGSGTLTARGSATFDDQLKTLKWDFTVTLTGTSTSGDSASISVRRYGSLTVTSSSIDGYVLSDVTASWNIQGQGGAVAVSEAVLLDNITFDSSGITGGSLEAKRVWTRLPPGASSADPDFRDRGAEITWQSASVVTVALSN